MLPPSSAIGTLPCHSPRLSHIASRPTSSETITPPNLNLKPELTVSCRRVAVMVQCWLGVTNRVTEWSWELRSPWWALIITGSQVQPEVHSTSAGRKAGRQGRSAQPLPALLLPCLLLLPVLRSLPPLLVPLPLSLLWPVLLPVPLPLLAPAPGTAPRTCHAHANVAAQEEDEDPHHYRAAYRLIVHLHGSVVHLPRCQPAARESRILRQPMPHTGSRCC